MTATTQLFVLLLSAGLLMVGAELFVPGAVLGTLGVASLVAAVVVAFYAFGPAIGFYIALGVLVLMAVSIAVWAKFFPRSSIGKKMTLAEDGRTFKASQEGLSQLAGKEGEAKSDLRPAGFALIEGRRVDVVTEGGMISKGDRVRVVQVEGNRVVVRRVNA